ncbi:succinate dehydrogenase|uniref:Succinate dehydrogenase subunit C n=1 Tax=Dendrosporobacter quercicolus TaxID=146817 RepID=A0A1H0ABX7_9FIRM|nr:succinate dehydrogenase [Dendrosporobacter quercicolus]NSL50029.1 succinate dehydrogenase [Dendrosporobacter quercicolus DSM 1736]SDN30483.1 succinate dehydrogenase subunit C [Dendrosporobacter quercicolus]
MSNTDFYLRRLHSISGIAPIGVFLLEHIFTISTVIAGPGVFDAAVAKLAAIPHALLLTLEICFIAIPLLFHGIYGAYIAMQAKNNVSDYGYLRNRQFWLQRMSAWYTFVYLIWHVGYLRIVVKGGGTPISYAFLHDYLSNPIVFVLYAIGLVAAIYHFTNGLFTFCITWGIAVGPRAQGIVNKAAWGLFVVLSGVGLFALTHYIA